MYFDPGGTWGFCCTKGFIVPEVVCVDHSRRTLIFYIWLSSGFGLVDIFNKNFPLYNVKIKVNAASVLSHQFW